MISDHSQKDDHQKRRKWWSSKIIENDDHQDGVAAQPAGSTTPLRQIRAANHSHL